MNMYSIQRRVSKFVLALRRYSVDVVLDKQLVNKDSLRDGKNRKKAKVEIRKKFEER